MAWNSSSVRARSSPGRARFDVVRTRRVAETWELRGAETSELETWASALSWEREDYASALSWEGVDAGLLLDDRGASGPRSAACRLNALSKP